MKGVNTVIRTVVGILFGALASIVLSPAMAAFDDGSGSNAWWFYVVVAIGGILGFFAPTLRRAFGRGFLVLGSSCLFLPLSAMLLSGKVTSDMVSSAQGDQAATMIGAGIGAAIVTGAASFLGLLFGSIFMITGLVLSLGGRREVIVVREGDRKDYLR